MVRLKGYNIFQKVRRCSISIPYGAIKSYYLKMQEPLLLLFQFLMVRLKASLQSSSKLIFKQFQFLMVRLKEQCRA